MDEGDYYQGLYRDFIGATIGIHSPIPSLAPGSVVGAFSDRLRMLTSWVNGRLAVTLGSQSRVQKGVF